MLTAIREGSKGWIASIIIGLIVLTFALFGISSYLEGGAEAPVAAVNGDEISNATYQNELSRQRQALLSRFGADFDPALLDSLGIKDRVLDNLVESRLLTQYVADHNYRLSDSQLATRIQQNPAFQTDGKFDPQRYSGLLESNRLTPEGYEITERQAAAEDQLQSAITESAFVVNGELQRLTMLLNQRREVRYAIFPAASYVEEFDISDQDARLEYEENMDEYQQEARIKIEYLELSVDELAETVSPSEDEIQQTYERLKGTFISPEIRRASHILFAYETDADDAAKAGVRTKAEAVLEEAEAGEDFAALARDNSDDTGSANNGGDLGVIARGQMAPAFEDTVYGLQEGEVSGLVETPFGIHIIKLTELVSGKQKPLSAVRDELVAEARRAQAEAQFAELVEPFQNLIFEQPDSLAPAADETGLELRTSDWFSIDQGEGIAAESAVRRAAFAEDVLQDGLNSQAIELGFDRMVAIRKLEYQEASPLPFEEVREQIVRNLKLERSREKVETVASESIQGLGHLASFDTMLANLELPVETLASQRSEVLPENQALADEVFAAPIPEAGQPDYGYVVLPNGDTAVYALISAEPGDPDSASEGGEQLAQVLQSRDGVGAYRQFIQHLRETAEVTVDRDRL